MSRPVGALSLFTRRTLSPFSTFLSLLQGTSGRSRDDGGESDNGGGSGGDGGSDGAGIIIMLVTVVVMMVISLGLLFACQRML